jgi:hypothetical protein
MAKDGSGIEKRMEAVMPKEAPPNGDAPSDDDNTGDVPGAAAAGIGDAGQASPLGGG